MTTRIGWGWIAGLLAAALGARAELVVSATPAPAGGSAPAAAATNAPPAEAPAGPLEDRLVFLDGDHLRGELVGVAAGRTSLHWRHPDAAAPIDFDPKRIATVLLRARGYAAAPAVAAQVELTNGDTLAGTIRALDAETLTLATDYAGVLKLRRPMIRALRPTLGGGGLIYEGPGDAAGWVSPSNRNQGWEFKGGAMASRQPVPIGRKLDALPDAVRIEFEVQWQNQLYMNLMIFTDDLRNARSGYAFDLNQERVNLVRRNANGGGQSLGYAEFDALNGKSRGRIAVLADRASGLIAIEIEGKIVKQWTDAQAAQLKGDGVMFMPQSGNRLTIRALRVTRWNGKLPTAAGATADERAEELVTFINGDTLSGALTGIRDGQAQIKTAYATLPVPLERIESVQLSTAASGKARRMKEDVRAYFQAGGTVTFQLAELADGKLRGASENFGEVAMPLAAFRRLDFNLYEKRADAGEEGDLTAGGAAAGPNGVPEGAVQLQVLE